MSKMSWIIKITLLCLTTNSKYIHNNGVDNNVVDGNDNDSLDTIMDDYMDDYNDSSVDSSSDDSDSVRIMKGWKNDYHFMTSKHECDWYAYF